MNMYFNIRREVKRVLNDANVLQILQYIYINNMRGYNYFELSKENF